ncbi:MAG: hypothetical protein AB7L92_02565 [Alphaproteobacteria bacterium]
MLDAISDFWKPAKKNQSADKINPNDLQIGSSIGFGFVPQASLSGRRLLVAGVQTYKFGEEKLTSFQLSPDKDSTPQVSMIVAEADDEQYLAISRRISINDRMKLFDSQGLENVVEKAEVTTLECKDGTPDFKGWTVATYKREMQKMTGYLYKGDFRKDTLPSLDEAQEFKYTLLVSDNNEHAIEIEKYKDGRMEVYATIYRRISDIGEVAHPTRTDMLNRPDLKLASTDTAKAEEPKKPEPAVSKEAPKTPEPVAVKPEVKQEPAKKEPLPFKELEKEKPVAETKPAEQPKPAPKPASQPVQAAPQPKPQEPSIQKEKPAMAHESTMNGSYKQSTPSAAVINKATENRGMSNNSVECELRVANRIIEEAIRNEMRLSDVVRKIIELPVANQQVVHLPIELSDEDYALLGIRYGVPASDKNAIRQRIVDDLGSFSGEEKRAAA